MRQNKEEEERKKIFSAFSAVSPVDTLRHVRSILTRGNTAIHHSEGSFVSDDNGDDGNINKYYHHDEHDDGGTR